MADEESKPLAYVPEVILKKRKSNEEWAIRRKQQLEQRVRKSKEDNSFFKRPEQFIQEYRDKELDLVQMKHRGKRRRPELESKLLFVMRIQGKNDMHPKTRKILYSLRLRRRFNGVFVKANERILEMLQKVEPFVTYGSRSISDLLTGLTSRTRIYLGYRLEGWWYTYGVEWADAVLVLWNEEVFIDVHAMYPGL